MNFMMRDVTENSEESKKCCRPRRDGSQIENFRKSQRTKLKVMVLLELATNPVLKICFGPPTAESKNLKNHVNFGVGDLFFRSPALWSSQNVFGPPTAGRVVVDFKDREYDAAASKLQLASTGCFFPCVTGVGVTAT